MDYVVSPLTSNKSLFIIQKFENVYTCSESLHDIPPLKWIIKKFPH